MLFYYGLLAGICLLWAILRVGGRSKIKDRAFLITVFVVFTVLSVSRYDVGFDYSYVYGPEYEAVLQNPDFGFGDTRFEPGFVLLEKIVAAFSDNYHMIFVVTSIIILGLFFVYFWFNAPNPFVAVFFFITLSQFYCTLDFLRQSIAAGILMVAFPLLKQRKAMHYLGYLGAVLVAACFHKSAIVMVLFLLVNLLPVQNPFVLSGFLVVTVFLYINAPQVMQFITNYWYGGYARGEWASHKFEPWFAVAAFLWFLLLLLGSKVLTRRDKSNYLYVNYAFFSFFFVLMGTRHHVLDRLSMYFMFAVPVGFSILFEEMAQDKKDEMKPILREGILKMGRHRFHYIMTVAVAIIGSLFIHDYALYMDHHGVVPYKIVWNQPFYKEYTRWLEIADDEPLRMGELDLHEPETGPEQTLPE